VHLGLLFAYVVAIGIETGAGLFTSVAVFPVWTASPEIVIGWEPAMPYFVQEGAFFMFSSSATTLLALVVLILNRRFPTEVRRWVVFSTATFLVIAAWTGAYFLPVQTKMQGARGALLPRDQLAAMLGRFVGLNWLRQALLVAAFLTALHALGLLYRKLASQP
jgi:hypothetical protein